MVSHWLSTWHSRFVHGSDAVIFADPPRAIVAGERTDRQLADASGSNRLSAIWKSLVKSAPPLRLVVPYKSSRRLPAPLFEFAPVFRRPRRLSYQWTAMFPSWSSPRSA